MRAHVIDGGKVANTIEVESLNALPGVTLIEASLGGKIGDLWDGVAFTAPPVAVDVPVAVSMRQARLALLQAGLLATVNSAIVGMTGVEGEAARIEWEYATEVRRDSPLVAALAPVLAMTDAQIDALFVTAAGL